MKHFKNVIILEALRGPPTYFVNIKAYFRILYFVNFNARF